MPEHAPSLPEFNPVGGEKSAKIPLRGRAKVRRCEGAKVGRGGGFLAIPEEEPVQNVGNAGDDIEGIDDKCSRYA